MKPTVIIIVKEHESVLKSITTDAVTFLTVTGIIGVGVHFESTTMQVVGALMLLPILAMALRGVKTAKPVTVDEARDQLDEIEHEYHMGMQPEGRALPR